MSDEVSSFQFSKGTSRYLTPVIFWRQKGDYVWAKIIIKDVKEGDYKFEVRKEGFTLIADAGDEKVYWLDIETFGLLAPQSFACNITGQYMEVKFQKYFKGFEWPQLSLQSHRNIKFDPNYVTEYEKESLSLIEKMFERVELRQKLGLPDHHAFKRNKNEKILVSEEDSDDSEAGDVGQEASDGTNAVLLEKDELLHFL